MNYCLYLKKISRSRKSCICNVIRLNINKNKSIKGFELEIKSLVSKIDQSVSFESAGTFFYDLHPVRIGRGFFVGKRLVTS